MLVPYVLRTLFNMLKYDSTNSFLTPDKYRHYWFSYCITLEDPYLSITTPSQVWECPPSLVGPSDPGWLRVDRPVPDPVPTTCLCQLGETTTCLQSPNPEPDQVSCRQGMSVCCLRVEGCLCRLVSMSVTLKFKFPCNCIVISIYVCELWFVICPSVYFELSW